MISLQRSQQAWSLGHRILRGTWIATWYLLVRPGPRRFSPWRVWLLRMFGAKIGRDCRVCPGVKVLMPWNLEMGDYSVLGDRVDVYNFAKVVIGTQTCISQGVWLCTGSHDHRLEDFPLIWKPIEVGDFAWLAAEAFIHPGTRVGKGCVVGARAVASGDLAEWTIYAGNPARPVGRRELNASRPSSAEPVRRFEAHTSVEN
jgi:putative colanic acid biosynthesis acetyltransferase WcaF